MNSETAAWRRRESRCLFLSLIPYLGFFGFHFMYRRTGRGRYRTLVRTYLLLQIAAWFVPGILGMASCYFAGSSWRMYDLFCFYTSFTGPLFSPFYTLGVTACILPMIVYTALIVHTFLLRNDYLYYLEAVQSNEREPEPLLKNKAFCREHLRWQIWMYLPFVHGFALMFAGSRHKERRLFGFGLGQVLLTAAGLTIFSLSTVIQDFLPPLSLYDRPLHTSFILHDLCTYHLPYLLAALWLGEILFLIGYRKIWLEKAAEEWSADAMAFPQMADPSWTRKNTSWQIFTFLPVIGGIGIIRGALPVRERKVLRNGLILLLIPVLLLVLNYVFTAFVADNLQTDYGISRYTLFQMVQGLLQVAMVFLYAGTIWYGCTVRRTLLLAKAARLNGYRSQTDHEIDQLMRYHRKGTPIMERTLQENAATQARVSALSGLEMPENAKSPVPDAGTDPVPRQTAGMPAQPEERPDRYYSGHPLREYQQSRTARILEEQAAGADGAAPEKTDLNTCTEGELLLLPGVDIITARKALAYRKEHEGFRSVDEFVDVLNIKPHFAVQIFERASADKVTRLRTSNEGAAPADGQPYPPHAGSRRTFDL